MNKIQQRSLVNNAFYALLIVAAIAFSTSALAQRVNVGHLAPFADTIDGTEVSVEVDGGEVLDSVFYNQFSGYLDLSDRGDEGTLVEIFAPPNDGDDTPAISDSFDFFPGEDSTVVAIGNGSLQDLQLLRIVDAGGLNDQPSGEPSGATIRVVHAAPFAAPDDGRSGAAVSIRFANGDLVDPSLANFEFSDVSDFLNVPAGTYDLQVRSPDGSVVLIDPLPVDLAPGDRVTLFAVGDIINQPLGITAFFTGGANEGVFAELPLRGTVPESNPVPTMGTIGLFLMVGLLALVAVRRLA